MDAIEKSFLQKMDEVANYKEQWIKTGTVPGVRGDSRVAALRMNAAGIVSAIEDKLKEAGRIVGMNTRWHVFVQVAPCRDLHFVAKNGQSGRMLQRYEELYMEREISDGY